MSLIPGWRIGLRGKILTAPSGGSVAKHMYAKAKNNFKNLWQVYSKFE